MDTQDTDSNISLKKQFVMNTDSNNAQEPEEFCTKVNVPYDNCLNMACTSLMVQNEQKCFYTVDNKFLVRFD